MTSRAAPAVIAPGDLVEALAAAVAAEGTAWFPDFGSGPVRLHFRTGAARARCFLYRFDLSDGGLTRPVVVKVRHSQPDLRRLNRFEHRPVLAPVRTMSDRDSARREYEGLQLIHDALHGDATGRFGVLRPLAWLPDHAAIVTDLIEDRTLRAVVLGRSRFRLTRRPPLDESAWRNAGAWLRLFHTHPTSLALPPRSATAADVGNLYRTYADFLAERLGGRRPLLEDLSTGGLDIAARSLPAALPMGTGHGDFVASNMFVGGQGRVTAFDPLPIWRLPIHQDLATLVVGLRVLPLQAATQGLALPRDTLEHYESEILRGYFGDDPVPVGAVLAFQLLALLDRWAALVSQQVQHGALRRRVHDGRVRIASQHYHREARRLVRRLEADVDQRGPYEPGRATAVD